MTSVGGPIVWAIFGVVVTLMLALDLGVFHRRPHVVRFREAALWSLVWIGLALLFNVLVYVQYGANRGLEFFQAWLIEKALSVDNIFVFLAAFSYFAVPEKLQHRVLFWGIIGALITRGVFILVGAALLAMFHWVVYVFGVFLVITAVAPDVRQGRAGLSRAQPGAARVPPADPGDDGVRGRRTSSSGATGG